MGRRGWMPGSRPLASSHKKKGSLPPPPPFLAPTPPIPKIAAHLRGTLQMPEAARPRVLRPSNNGVAQRRVGPASPPVHRVASLLRADWRQPGPYRERHQAGRHTAGLLSGCRHCGALAGRAQRPSAADRDTRAASCGRRLVIGLFGRRGAGGRGSVGRRPVAASVHRRRRLLCVCVQPGAVARTGARRLLVRPVVGRVPGAHRLLRADRPPIGRGSGGRRRATRFLMRNGC